VKMRPNFSPQAIDFGQARLPSFLAQNSCSVQNIKFDKAAADMEYTHHTPLQLLPKANYVNFRHCGVFAKF
jgi:hypothetical protein